MTQLPSTIDPMQSQPVPHDCPTHGFSLIFPWICQIVVAAILVQTLYFKFTYAPETQYIFAERGGRWMATFLGVVELISAILLLVPGYAAFGAGLSLGVIAGAIFTHLTSLGIEIPNPETGETDGGLLFLLACVVAVGSVLVLVYRWKQLLWLKQYLLGGN